MARYKTWKEMSLPLKVFPFIIAANALILLWCVWLLTVAALADNSRNTRYHCESDYLAFCHPIKAYTSKARACMRKHQHRLSLNCLKALGKAGYRR